MITVVKAICPHCYVPHKFNIEDLHPQMVKAWFTCPVCGTKFLGAFTKVK